jgi:hypothetical protein
MADPYVNVNGLRDQGRKLTAITPADGADLADVPKALLIGGTGGNISIDDVGGGATAVIIPVTAGQVFSAVRVKRVRSTGTTATPIYAIS